MGVPSEIPAFARGGMRGIGMDPSEQDWASMKCGGDPHTHAEPTFTGEIAMIDPEEKKVIGQWQPPREEHLPPSPDPLMPPTSEPTEMEQLMIEQFSDERMHSVTGIARLLVHTAVKISRYERSMHNDPEHYKRLTESATFMAQARFATSVREEGVSAAKVRKVIEEVSWHQTRTHKPVISIPLPDDGTETPLVTFRPATAFQRRSLPA